MAKTLSKNNTIGTRKCKINYTQEEELNRFPPKEEGGSSSPPI